MSSTSLTSPSPTAHQPTRHPNETVVETIEAIHDTAARAEAARAVLEQGAFSFSPSTLIHRVISAGYPANMRHQGWIAYIVGFAEQPFGADFSIFGTRNIEWAISCIPQAYREVAYAYYAFALLTQHPPLLDPLTKLTECMRHVTSVALRKKISTGIEIWIRSFQQSTLRPDHATVQKVFRHLIPGPYTSRAATAYAILQLHTDPSPANPIINNYCWPRMNSEDQAWFRAFIQPFPMNCAR
ncbi:MAG: hypothetical protein RL235_399 [Chlamydiota bacterium]|jgi:hypothetical protein